MAIEPISPRKREVKKSRGKSKAEVATPEVAEEKAILATKSAAKKAAAIPVPIFQAAEVVAPKRVASQRAKKADSDKVAETEEPVSDDHEDSDSRGGRNRRRRRGGRGRR